MAFLATGAVQINGDISADLMGGRGGDVSNNICDSPCSGAHPGDSPPIDPTCNTGRRGEGVELASTSYGANFCGAGNAANGEALFASNGCSACHSTGDATIVGPGLQGIGDRQDDSYLRESIVDPGAVIADGFDPLMPAFTTLSDSAINDLVAYLKTLK